MIKKGQGLPLNTIVLAALAVLVLLLLVGFTTGGLSRIFKGMASPIKTVDLQTAQQECQQYCNELKSLESLGELTEEKVANSQYKLATFAIDINKDGHLDDTEKNLKCWMYPINVQCQVSLKIIEYKKCEDLEKDECEKYNGCHWNEESEKCEGKMGYREMYKICSVEDPTDPNGFRCT